MSLPKENARVLGGRRVDQRTADHAHCIRRPPAFQEYGSDLLCLESVRLMSLGERGLLATMRWYVWTNDSLPRDLKDMARVLGLDAHDVETNYTGRVSQFFKSNPDDPLRLICPELRAQMQRMMERRRKQADGGKYGARQRREKRNQAISNLEVNNEVDHQVLEKSREEQNRTEPVYRNGDMTGEFVKDMGGPSEFEKAAARRGNGAAHA
ncbi:MAG: hypothetical protein HYY78_19810 [Betaproteobacteria bacterium]|nr:hypothetical protein [Betaproteobacteria bacterium]